MKSPTKPKISLGRISAVFILKDYEVMDDNGSVLKTCDGLAEDMGLPGERGILRCLYC